MDVVRQVPNLILPPARGRSKPIISLGNGVSGVLANKTTCPLSEGQPLLSSRPLFPCENAEHCQIFSFPR